MELITSVNNPRVKAAAELKQKKFRQQAGLFLVEGLRAAEEAVRYGQVQTLFYTQSGAERLQSLLTAAEQKKAAVLEVQEHVMAKLSDTQSQQGVLAVAALPRQSLAAWEKAGPDQKDRFSAGVQRSHANLVANNPVLVLDRVQDPGNLGAIIRTADAVGAAGVLLLQGCADAFAPKVVRASMGSLFHLPIVENVAPEEFLTWCIQNGYEPAVTCKDGAQELYKADLTRRLALILGNEANGVSEGLKKAAQIKLSIPMLGAAESLNVAASAAVVLYEGLRQRLA